MTAAVASWAFQDPATLPLCEFSADLPTQVGATPDHSPLAWQVLVLSPSKTNPWLQLWVATERKKLPFVNMMDPELRVRRGHWIAAVKIKFSDPADAASYYLTSASWFLSSPLLVALTRPSPVSIENIATEASVGSN